MGVEYLTPDPQLGIIAIIGLAVAAISAFLVVSGLGIAALGIVLGGLVALISGGMYLEQDTTSDVTAALEAHYDITLPEDAALNSGERFLVEGADGTIREVYVRINDDRIALLVDSDDGAMEELNTSAIRATTTQPESSDA